MAVFGVPCRAAAAAMLFLLSTLGPAAASQDQDLRCALFERCSPPRQAAGELPIKEDGKPAAGGGAAAEAVVLLPAPLPAAHAAGAAALPLDAARMRAAGWEVRKQADKQPPAQPSMPATHPAARSGHTRLLSHLQSPPPLPVDRAAETAVLEAHAAAVSRLLLQVLSAAADELPAERGAAADEVQPSDPDAAAAAGEAATTDVAGAAVTATAGADATAGAGAGAAPPAAAVAAAETAAAASELASPPAAVGPSLWLWLLLGGSFGAGVLLFAAVELVHHRTLARQDSAAAVAAAEAGAQFRTGAAEEGKENSIGFDAATQAVIGPAAAATEAAAADAAGLVVAGAELAPPTAAEHQPPRPAVIRPLRDELPPRRDESPPGSPVFGAGFMESPPPPPVDESVRRRNVTARGWAPIPGSSDQQERSFSSPLLSLGGAASGEGALPKAAEPAAGPEAAGDDAPPALPGTPKLVQRNESEASASSQASSDFRLGAAVARSSTGDRLAGLLQRRPTAGAAGGSAAGPGLAPRKLTGAQSIGPQDARLVVQLQAAATADAQGLAPTRRSSTAGSGGTAAPVPSRFSGSSITPVVASKAPRVQEMKRQASSASSPAVQPAGAGAEPRPQGQQAPAQESLVQRWLYRALSLLEEGVEEQPDEQHQLQQWPDQAEPAQQQQQPGHEQPDQQPHPSEQQPNQQPHWSEQQEQQEEDPEQHQPGQQQDEAWWPPTQPAEVQDLSGEQFQAHVALGRILGAGGAGTVYEASWRQRRVAVKVLHPSVQADPRYALAFQREVQVMATVGGHPHTVPLLAACRTPPHCALITPLAATSLGTRLGEQRLRPQWGLLLEIAGGVAAALRHCHSLAPPVVHRDLKPENVLLWADGTAAVADWGLAKAKHRTFLTHEGGAPGTPAYTAPEVFAGGAVDHRADVFSFAMLCWAMLAGRHPWEEMDSPLQIVWAVGAQRRRPPLPDGCPPAMARLITDCWRQSPAARPSFDDIAARIERMRQHDAFKALPLPKSIPLAGAVAGGSSAGSSRSSSPIRAARQKPRLVAEPPALDAVVAEMAA